MTTTVRVRPGPLVGRLRAPGSKSYTHRALVAGHLSRRSCRVIGGLRSDDTLRTVAALRALGTRVELNDDVWRLQPGPAPTRPPPIDCGESGTTLRFAAALAALRSGRTRFRGRGRLPRRPMRSLLDALHGLGARTVGGTGTRSLPLTVEGPIHGGHVRVEASESSQFASALLLALPTVEPSSRLELAGPVVSAPYLDATVAVAAAHGVRILGRRPVYRIPGGQTYAGGSFRVPGDASSAAYLWAGAAISGGSVVVDGISDRWPQADRAVLGLLRRFGADVRESATSVRVSADRRRPFRADLTASPDLYPLAGVLAATARGTSRLEGAPHVVAKESDRRAETARLAEALGAKVRRRGGGLAISGSDRPRAFELRGVHDHRVVMSAAVGALAADRPSRISDAAAVAKSFPTFFSVLATLGARRMAP